ncbi:MAG: hypothetical protein J6P44_09120 [Bacteroidales bacterium]|nr:hypothetical protein [Bacteroidales bacterium]
MIKKTLKLLLTVTFLSFIFSGCDNFEGEQTVPSYIRVKGFKLVADSDLNFTFPQDDGFLTSDICDVWVRVTDNNEQKEIGAYSLTKDGDLIIPVLAKGKRKVELRPGVKFNGMNATREAYRYYTTYIDTLELKEGEITDVDIMEVSYNSLTNIARRITFEETYNPFENISTTNPDLPCYLSIVGDGKAAYGDRCGVFYSSSSSDNYRFITKDSVSWDGKTSPMIMEIDYHANIPFEIGLYGRQMQESNPVYISCLRIKPNHNPSYADNDKRNWQKMYVILGKVWGQLKYNDFKIWFQPVNTDNLSDGFVYIDNIKVIHDPQ